MVNVFLVRVILNLHLGVVVSFILRPCFGDVEEAVVGPICLVVFVQELLQRGFQDLHPLCFVWFLLLECFAACCAPVDLAIAKFVLSQFPL
jgi:hypothetical protein